MGSQKRASVELKETKVQKIYARGNGKEEEESLSKSLYFFLPVVTLHNKGVKLFLDVICKLICYREQTQGNVEPICLIER